MEKSFKVSVYLKKSKTNRKNLASIYGRITINGVRSELSLLVKSDVSA